MTDHTNSDAADTLTKILKNYLPHHIAIYEISGVSLPSRILKDLRASGFDVVNVRGHLDFSRFAQEMRDDARMTAIEQRLTALAEQQRTFVSYGGVNVRLNAVEQRLTKLDETKQQHNDWAIRAGERLSKLESPKESAASGYTNTDLDKLAGEESRVGRYFKSKTDSIFRCVYDAGELLELVCEREGNPFCYNFKVGERANVLARELTEVTQQWVPVDEVGN